MQPLRSCLHWAGAQRCGPGAGAEDQTREEPALGGQEEQQGLLEMEEMEIPSASRL